MINASEAKAITISNTNGHVMCGTTNLLEESITRAAKRGDYSLIFITSERYEDEAEVLRNRLIRANYAVEIIGRIEDGYWVLKITWG